ncbi:uncharacterized protein LOC135690401 [Rhopilema esculentum]|uniref:uncharacterized protein LOC135690401 n=1 Tax=Rhopilema esculentum TaxID=499914 RepID=UPI0031DC295C|eukprot:gene3741-15017_t
MEETLNFTCPRLFSEKGSLKIYHISVTYILVSKIIGVINLAAILPTLVINLLLAVTLIKTKSLQTVQNLIILLIVFLNLGQGIISMPAHGILLILRSMKRFSCVADALICYFGASLAMSSMFAADLLAYDRYDAIRNPFKHEVNFTKAKLRNTIIVFVIFSLLNSVMFFIAPLVHVAISLASAVMIGTYVFNVIVHILMMRTVAKLRLRHEEIIPKSLDLSIEEKRERQRKEKRTVRFTLYVIGFLLICYAPSLFKNFFFSLMTTQDYLNMVSDTILLLHATISPILYIWQAPQIGRAVLKQCNCLMNSRVEPINTQSIDVDGTK